jgi:hypothetical protein
VKTFDKTPNIEKISLALYFANVTLVLHVKVKKDFLKYHSLQRVRSFNRKKFPKRSNIHRSRTLRLREWRTISTANRFAKDG